MKTLNLTLNPKVDFAFSDFSQIYKIQTPGGFFRTNLNLDFEIQIFGVLGNGIRKRTVFLTRSFFHAKTVHNMCF